MDFDDDDAHPCGCDRACVCSDRFSWFAVPPTPVYCDGTFAADSLQVHQIPPRGCTPLEIFHLNFRSLFQSQHHEFDKSHCIGKSLRSARQVCARRTHEASRSEHDLNLAILYAVQSGFAIQLRFFCLTCAAALLENYAPGVQGNAAPSSKGDSVARKLVGSGRYSKCFFIPRGCLPGPAIQACDPDLQCCAS